MNVNRKGNNEYRNELNEIGWMKCISSCVGELSPSFRTACTTDHVTCEEDSEINTSIDMLHLPYSFSLLDVQPSKSSNGKCWVFHMNLKGELKGYIFPSGYKLYGEENKSPNHGECILEN